MVRGYIFSRPFMGERVPQHVQNLVIREYCERNDLLYLLSATEYSMSDCHLMLEALLDELPKLQGIVAYSLFQLPESDYARNRILDRVIAEQKIFHFAVEGLSVQSIGDHQRMEWIWKVRREVDNRIENDVARRMKPNQQAVQA